MGNSYSSRARPPASTPSSPLSRPSHGLISSKGHPPHSSSGYARVAKSNLPNLLERMKKDKVRSMSVEINFVENETPTRPSAEQRRTEFMNRLAAAEQQMTFSSSSIPREESPTLKCLKPSSRSPPDDLAFIPDASSSPRTPTKSRSLRSLKTPWTPKSSADIEAERAEIHRLHQERRAEFIALMAEGQTKIDAERERLARDNPPLFARSMTTPSSHTDKSSSSVPRSLRTPRQAKYQTGDLQQEDSAEKRRNFMERLTQGQATIDAFHAKNLEQLQGKPSATSKYFASTYNIKPFENTPMAEVESVFHQRKEEYVAKVGESQNKIDAVRMAHMDSPAARSFTDSDRSPVTPPAPFYNHRLASTSSVNTTSSWKSRGLRPLRLLQSRSSSTSPQFSASPRTPTPSVGDPDVSIPSSRKGAPKAIGRLVDPFRHAPANVKKPTKASSAPVMRGGKGENVFDGSFAKFRSPSGKNMKRLELDGNFDRESLFQAMQSVTDFSDKEHHKEPQVDATAARTSVEWVSDESGVYHDAAQELSFDKAPLTLPGLSPETTKDEYQNPILSPEIVTPTRADPSRVSIKEIIDDAFAMPELKAVKLFEASTIGKPAANNEKTRPRQTPEPAESPDGESDISTSSEEVSRYVQQDCSLMSLPSEYSDATAAAEASIFYELGNLKVMYSDSGMSEKKAQRASGSFPSARADDILDLPSFGADESGPIHFCVESFKASSNVELLSERDETFESLPSVWSQPSLVIRASEDSVRHVVESVYDTNPGSPGPPRASGSYKRASVVISSPDGSIPGITISDMSDDIDNDPAQTSNHPSPPKSQKAPAPRMMRENDPSSIAYPRSLKRAPTRDKTGRSPLSPLSPNLSRKSRNTLRLGKATFTQPLVQDKGKEQGYKEGKKTLKEFAMKRVSMIRMRSGSGEYKTVGQGLRMF
ncbi:hypothetical protein IAR50_005214 [Cryptococcus sp. DSM 104548]